MSQIFYWILNMAIVGSMVGVLLLLIRKMKRLPRNLIYALYLILLIRLVCPVGISNGLSFLNLLPKGTVRQVNPATGENATAQNSLLLSNMVQDAASYKPWKLKSDGWELAYQIGAAIWAVIGMSLFLTYCYMYILSMKELKRAQEIEKDIYRCDAVDSPMTTGILRPRIMLPYNLDEKSPCYPYVIAHERTHIKKMDNLWRLIAIVLSCIYWFNPLIWILQKYFFTDMELACDESTIRTYTNEERKKYAQALLGMSAREPIVYAAGFAAGSVKVRIKRVLSYRKITFASCICFFGLFLLCAICLLSNR